MGSLRASAYGAVFDWRRGWDKPCSGNDIVIYGMDLFVYVCMYVSLPSLFLL